MKKIVSILCFFLIAFVLDACSQNALTLFPTSSENKKVLVAYFSNTGTTERIANLIAEDVNAQTYEIKAANPYTVDDLNYNDSNSRANREQRDTSVRPVIDGKVGNISQYDIVFLGYPIWQGQAPRIISTFIESYDWSGQTIIPFATSHSSGLGSSDQNLHSLTSEVTWLSGRRFSGTEEIKIIRDWIEKLNLNINRDVSVFDLSSGVNGSAPTVLLNSGYRMPILGLGTYSLQGEVVKKSVLSALDSGVRLIDTAFMYGNEREIGEAIRASNIPREEIFVITKIYPGEQFSNPKTAIQNALDKLDIGYIDMMLLHHPGENDVKAYKAMEQAVYEGKIRSLGLSNYYIKEINEFIPQVTIMPSLVQNEVHPYYQEQDVIPYMHNLGIVMQAWYPFGGRGHTGILLSDETIVDISKAHDRTPAQIILRWHLQRGVVAIPGSSNPEHIKENISVFDFQLTKEEMSALESLDRNEKHDWY